jgi:hypothetical protein
MQGAVSSFIWSNNDPAYQKVYFSQDSMYWKERLRSAAFAYVLSAQFEIGPASEASLGNLQSYYPATGFVDHVVTPIVGMGWSIGEDALDRYVIRSFEGRTDSRVLRVLARSMLNPARSFANLMGGKYPWYRTNRPAPSAYDSASYFMAGLARKPEPPPGVAPFEFHADGLFRTYVGAGAVGACVGGSAGVGLRVAREWQIVTDVSGCKMTDVPYKTGYGSFTDTSGDSLTYVVGPRWTRQQSERWSTHAQFLVGGNKVTQQHLDPEKEHVTYEVMKDKDVWPPPYNQFAHSWDSNAVAIVAGAGVDMKFNNALKLRMALDYAHTWNRDLNDISYRNSLQFKTGLVLQMGTW